MNYAVIADNGGGPNLQYHDVVGKIYTFPKSYQKILVPGTKVIYLRGGKTEENARLERMMDEAHYFGTAVIGDVEPTEKNNLRATITDFVQFANPVPFNNGGEHYETAEGRFWRNGVRKITEAVYNAIVAASKFAPEPKKKSAIGDRGKKTKTTLDTGIESSKFADDQFQVVTAKDGYYILSLVDHIYYKLCALKGISFSSGKIVICSSAMNKNNFRILHRTMLQEKEIGIVTLVDHGVNFGSARIIKESVKMMM